MIEVGDEIELTTSDTFPSFDHALLKDAVDSSNKSNVSLIVVENDEVVLFEITPRGLQRAQPGPCEVVSVVTCEPVKQSLILF